MTKKVKILKGAYKKYLVLCKKEKEKPLTYNQFLMEVAINAIEI